MNTYSAPFTITGTLVIIAAGFIAASVAYHPTYGVIWMVAYMILVAGVSQYALGAGQAALSYKLPKKSTVWGQWSVLNLGHVIVIAASLLDSFKWLLVGTVIYVAAMAWFVIRRRKPEKQVLAKAYVLLAFTLITASLMGLLLFQYAHAPMT